MNVINRLTLRHMGQNRKRTLVTIIGVILSVTMLGAISVGASSFVDVMLRRTIKDTGEWHIQYTGVDKEKLEQIKADKNTGEVLLESAEGFSVLPGSENEFKPYLFLTAYSEQALEKLPVNLISGRLPENGNEVVISDHIRTNGGVTYQIGDSIELNLGDRVGTDGKPLYEIPYENRMLFSRSEDGTAQETLDVKRKKTVTVVGICERISLEARSAPGYTIVTRMDETQISPYSDLTVRVIAKKVNNGIYNNGEDFADKLGVRDVSFNYDLLNCYGVFSNGAFSAMIFAIVAIMGTIVMIGSVSLIYNAFAISVSERSRYLGMLASVGATKKQKRRSVYFEGAVIGAVSIPFGILFAIIGLGVTFACVNPLFQEVFGLDTDLRISVSWWAVLLTVVMAVITIWISTRRPAKRASKVSPIDAIRQSNDIKITARQVKTSRLTKKLFGFSGDIALKNLKRNKKRYKTTIFSISMSIILFITVFSFLDNLERSSMMDFDGINYDIELTAYHEMVEGVSYDEEEAVFDQVAKLERVEQSARAHEYFLTAEIPEKLASRYLSEYYSQEKMENGNYLYSVSVVALDDISLAKAAKGAGTSLKELKDKNGFPVILLDHSRALIEDGKKFVTTNTLNVSVGDRFVLEESTQKTKQEVTVVGRLEEKPFGVTGNWEGLTQFTLLVSNDTAKRMQGINHSGYHMYLTSNSATELEKEIRELTDGTIALSNIYAQKQSAKQYQLFFSIFGYGFIVLITLICAANIFNTVSTSMALRKREFAMLRSIGMTPKQFNRMIRFESLFYGLKGLLYGLPVSLAAAVLIHKSFGIGIEFDLAIPWEGIVIAVVAVFAVIGLTMLYAGSKLKKENIIDTLRQENI